MAILGEADAVLSAFQFGRLMENGSAVHIAVAASVFFLAEAGRRGALDGGRRTMARFDHL